MSSASSQALAIPDPTKQFQLYMNERKGITKEWVLIQTLGPWKKTVVYLSKKLDPVVGRWPPCIHIVAAATYLVKDADKILLGEQLEVTTPYSVEGTLKEPPGMWISSTWPTHHQGLLLDSPGLWFTSTSTLTPATSVAESWSWRPACTAALRF